MSVEIILLAAPDAAKIAHQRRYFIHRPLDRRAFADRDEQGRDVGVSGNPAVECLERQDHEIVLVAAEGRGALGLEQSDDLAGERLDPDYLANRVGSSEKALADGLADDADGLA